MNVPKRKSSRLEGKPATNYNESALDVINKGDRKHTRSNLLDRHGTEIPSTACDGWSCVLHTTSKRLPLIKCACSRGCVVDAVVSQEEVYTEEHIKLLREYEEPWCGSTVCQQPRSL